MKVKYKGESCELIQEISGTLFVVQYHGKPILAERKELIAPGDEKKIAAPEDAQQKIAASGDDRSENKRRGGSRKTETKAKKKAEAKK